MINSLPKSLLFLVAFAAITQGYFYYEAMHVMHLQPHRYPYPMLIAGSVLLMYLPIWGQRRGAVGLSYMLAVISCIAGVAMLVGIHHH
jgi:hypothetical protein